jgi:hypothetical protein
MASKCKGGGGRVTATACATLRRETSTKETINALRRTRDAGKRKQWCFDDCQKRCRDAVAMLSRCCREAEEKKQRRKKNFSLTCAELAAQSSREQASSAAEAGAWERVI